MKILLNYIKEKIKYIKLSEQEKSLLKFKDCDLVLYRMSNELEGIKESLGRESKNHKYYAFKHYLNFLEYFMILNDIENSTFFCDIDNLKNEKESHSIAYRYTVTGDFFANVIKRSKRLSKYFILAILVVLYTHETLPLSDELLDCLAEMEKLVIDYYRNKLRDWQTSEIIKKELWKVLGCMIGIGGRW